MSEYETYRETTEEQAFKSGAMTRSNIRDARHVGRMITASVGLTPERVWAMTRPMRKGA